MCARVFETEHMQKFKCARKGLIATCNFLRKRSYVEVRECVQRPACCAQESVSGISYTVPVYEHVYRVEASYVAREKQS